jgi:hypothetical protein
MSNDLVVQLGAKLDQFQSDMNTAGDMADSAVSRIESSFAGLNPGLGGFAAFFTGALGSVGALLAALSSVNGQLADIQKNADFSGISTDRIQQLQFAAGQSGISNDQSATDLANVSKLLADANYNENSLTKLLDENNIKYKDRNGQIISLNQLLNIAGTLIGSFDSIPDKTKAAQMLGLSQGWVDALHGGSAAFEAVAQSANDAGVIIDSQTIAKAALFDQAWKASSATLSAEFKAVTADIAVYLDGLIDKANGFIASLNLSNGTAAGSGQTKFDAIADAVDIVAKDSVGAAQDVAQLTRVIDQLVSSGSGDPQIVAGLEEIRAKAQLAAGMIQQVNEQQSAAAFPGGVPLPSSRPAAANAKTGTGSLPSKDTSADAYDKAAASVEKLTAKTIAQVDAEGLGAGALAEYEAQAKLKTAADQAGIPITQKVLDQMQDLAQDAGEAADALAKAKVASDISRGSQTALFTPADLAIANQLKGIYGDDIPAAMASSQAASLKFNATIKDLGTLGQQVNSGFLVDFETQIRNGASAMAALQTAGVNALGKIADKLTQMAADNLWSSAFGGSTGGSGGFFASIFGSPTGAVNANGSIAGAAGPTSVGGAPLVGAFASGTDNAPGGMSLVGENGPEIMNIPKGAQVIPNDVLKGGGGSGVNSNVNFTINAPNADSEGLGRLQLQLEQLKAEIPSRVVSAVTLAKKQRKL